MLLDVGARGASVLDRSETTSMLDSSSGACFGVAGFSTGSAFVAIGAGNLEALLFTGAMLGAMLIARVFS
jgi:hypothetical protein